LVFAEVSQVGRRFILSMATWVRVFRGVMPELTGVPDGEFAAGVEWAVRNGLRRWWTVPALGTQTLAMAWVGGMSLPRLVRNPSLFMAVVCLVFCGGAALSCFRLVKQCRFFRESLKQALREELNRRGWPVCMQCGYDLHGQAEPRCSECGTASSSLAAQIEYQAAQSLGEMSPGSDEVGDHSGGGDAISK
jgi:hypothetical protein